MKHFILSIGFCVLNLLSLTTQGKEILLKNLKKNDVNIISAKDIDCKPGDIIVIERGIIAGLRFVNLRGTKQKPITIMNRNGQVQIKEQKSDGIKFDNCAHVHLTGKGNKTTKYGFLVLEAGLRTSGNGVSVANLSSDIEIDHMEIKKTGFTGMIAKTDPDCARPETWRKSGFVLRNLHIHDNYIHDTHGEGLYIGYTGGYLIKSKLKCGGKIVFGHWLENINIHHNKLMNIGWDGIQVNLARQNCSIHNNSILNYGIKRKEFHNFGMSIGAGVYQIYNNTIVQSAGNIRSSSGIQLISTNSGTLVYNNVINNAAGYGIFIHSRHKYASLNNGIAIVNNTIVKSGIAGILYNAQITTSTNAKEIGDKQLKTPFVCKNNIITNSGAKYEKGGTWKKEQENYIDFNDKAVRDAMQAHISGNLFSTNVYELKLKDPNKRNYQIANAASPAYNKGVDVSKYKIKTDISGLPRLMHKKYDAGANEFQK